jgi:VanZ family protein
MLYFIKKYPFSLILIGTVVFLSLLKPPAIADPPFPGWDKFVHFCMYGGISGILWLEFFFNYRYEQEKMKPWKVVVGAILCPVLLGGLMELGQMYLTSYRSGNWLDFMANAGGILVASLIAWYLLRPLIFKKK